MRKFIAIAALILGSQAAAQNFQPTVQVNGVTYNATVNTPTHVTYVQQDFMDFSLAADSFYVDVMTEEQWMFALKDVLDQGGIWNNEMYHLPTGEQVFVSDNLDPTTGNLMIVRLFGSID